MFFGSFLNLGKFNNIKRKTVEDDGCYQRIVEDIGRLNFTAKSTSVGSAPELRTPYPNFVIYKIYFFQM